jgi:hypothetical protein
MDAHLHSARKRKHGSGPTCGAHKRCESENATVRSISPRLVLRLTRLGLSTGAVQRLVKQQAAWVSSACKA